MKRRIFKIFSLLLVLVLIVGCTSSKVFDEGDFKITLTDDFEKGTLDSVTYYYESPTAGVTVLKETIESLKAIDITSDSSVEDYIKLVIEANEKSGDYKLKNNYAYFDYEASVEGTDFYYIAVTYKAKDAFWLVNFMCTKDQKSMFEKQFFEWADSVEV